RANHQVVIVDNGMEAVKAVMRMPFDLVLMDIQMPQTDGIRATELIRELPGACAKVPIIALTANAMKHDREKYLAAGMNDYVSKPINPDALTKAINRQVKHSQPTALPKNPSVSNTANVEKFESDSQSALEEQSNPVNARSQRRS
ncbi:MAG: response regulator, partial [Alphaproteobacteria bacterium]